MKNEKDELRKNIGTLKKLFKYLPEIKEDNIIPEDKLVGYMDTTNVIMVIPKTYFLKEILTKDFDVTETKIPELTFNDLSGTKGYYSINFLDLILPLLKNTTAEGFSLQCGKEYPLIFETKEVRIILAPRIMNDGVYL